MDYYLAWLVVKELLPDGGGSYGCFYWIITWCGWVLRDYYLMAAAAVGVFYWIITWYGWFLWAYYLIASAAVGVFIGLLPGVAGS